MENMMKAIGGVNCTITGSTSQTTKLVQYGQKLFHGEGHELILESHNESTRNAFIYIGLILFVYIMAVIAIAARYLLVRSNRQFLPFSPPYHFSTARRSTGFTTTATTTGGNLVVQPHVVTIENTTKLLQVGLKETQL